MANVLYATIIAPVVQILEFFFKLFAEITDNAGISVIGLSFVVTLCTLPLYMTAEKWQEEERRIQEKMKNSVARIKKAFRGDEQYMILSTYYRQNHYHPIFALRSSFSLLIQIPFFIAAYKFLSHLESLKGVSFLFIKDFGSPDRTFSIGPFSVNVLPVAMTMINCISGAIYSKGHGAKEKIQIFGCAAVFLLLLYNSPSGLVVYWTMNNILSLVKNIFYKIKNPLKTIQKLLFAAAILILASDLAIFTQTKTEFRILAAVFALILPCVPFAAKKISAWLDSSFKIFDDDKKIRCASFAFSAVLLAAVAGLGIPSMLMESEPEQYCYVEKIASPFFFLRYTFFQAAGFFILWPAGFYALFSPRIKKAFALIFPIAAFVSVLNTFAFSENYGPILPECIFMQPQLFKPTTFSLLLNAFLILAIIALVMILLKKNPRIISSVSLIFSVALFASSFRNIVKIGESYRKMTPPVVKDKIEPVYHLSKNGKNVIVIMQDRLFMPLIEPCLEEKPELREKFSGFEFYRNTVSFGKLTMIGTIGLFGGYSFTPWEVNQRTELTLQQKHNQALLTMPKVFHDAGFSVTVSGLPYENYLEYPTEKMYEGYEYVNRADTRGIYSDKWYADHGMKKVEFLAEAIKRNLIWFSFFKMVSPVFRRTVYHGEYWAAYDAYNDGLPRFIDNYSELDYLSDLTQTDENGNNFIMIDNELVHESILLNAPDFVPSEEKVTRFSSGKFAKEKHFTTMMAVLSLYAKFFDYLKENGVYDNTRIIIVSDHGTTLKNEDFGLTDDFPKLSKSQVTATLLVKDFGKTGAVTEKNDFMTNADTPYLATKEIVENAENPFTHFPFRVEDKAPLIKIQVSKAQSTRIRNETKFPVPKDEWFAVKDDIYVRENWSHFNPEEK